MKPTAGEKLFSCINGLLLVGLCLVTLYPFLYVLFASFSDAASFVKNTGLLFGPSGFDLGAYEAVLHNPMILQGYENTLLYVTIGTAINLIMTALGAYVTSRPRLLFGTPLMFLIVVTMVFHGGLIPNYLLVNQLGMMNTMWALLIPTAISTFNLIIMRTSFQGVPASLEESARIDGAGDWTILFRIILPLSMPVVAVMILWYAVGHWNSYFNALVYLRDSQKYPLQLVLRDILIANNTDSMMTGAGSDDKYAIGETIKYATIIISTLPIICLYPFLQKYFVKGIMIGAVKG